MRRSLLVFLLLVPILVFGQGKTITGKIVDSMGDPLPGVSILIEGTTQGAVTNINGEFNLASVPETATLQFSFIGFKNILLPVVGQSVFNITMEDDAIGLDEVVAVGYGVQKKSDVTGAMVRVDAEVLNSRPVANALEAMQGRAAGVDITTSERPGEVGKITIRGTRSIGATSEPLYVVDGIPLMSSSSIETLNPRDIESIDVLKDASATAIYGSRGANGVVIVTTKKGQEGKFRLSYSGTLTIENIKEKAPMMSASEYLTWRRWGYYNQDPTAYPRGDQPTIENDRIIFKADADPYAWNNIMNGWSSGSWDGSKVKSTDWTDFVTQTGITHEHSLSASGGSEKIQSYASFGYLSQEGTQVGQTYDRYTSKLSVDLQPTKWFSMGGSMNVTWSDQDYGMSTLGAGSSSGPNSVYDASKRVFSYAVPYDDEGERILLPGGDGNVYTIIGEQENSTQQRQMFRAMGSFYGQVDLGTIFKPLDGLKYRMNFGPDYRNWREGVYIDANSVNRLGGTSYARLNNQRDFSWTLDNMITYNKDVNNHNFGVTLLQTASSWNIEKSGMNAENIAEPAYLWNAFGTVDIADEASKASMSSDLEEKQLESYMIRLNYSLLQSYLLTVSGRWDGASQLSPGHKWSFFPSAALGWRMEQEEFLKSSSWVDQLKLRVGVGTTGNSGVDAYGTLGTIQSFFVPYGGQGNQQAYAPNEPNYTRDQIPMANNELGWEYTTQFNVGIDFSFVNGRIGGALDLYQSKTDDLLMDMNIPIVTGYRSTYANVGETKNKGVDFTLNTLNVTANGFEWSSNLNAAWQKNEIVSLAYGKNDMVDNTLFIGESINVIYGIKGNGLWAEADAVEMQKFNDNGADFEVGKVKPVDQNDDYIIDENDRVIIGDEDPHLTMGFNNTFTYKGIELAVMIYGRFGYQVDTGGEGQLGRYNQRSIDYWREDNTGADFQKPIYSESGGDAYSSILGYRSGSFLKIRNISLGYNLPGAICNKLGVQNLKLYVQAKNPGSLYSSIEWMDMDLNSSAYNRGFVFGLNVGF